MDDIKIRLALEGADQVQAGAQKAAEGLGKLGAANQKVGQQAQLNSYQMAQVSAQLQDFFVQVQGGQAPLTALLQQGSQLSAVFGGVGNAARAVAGLISPVVVGVGALAAVVGGAALAYNAGAEEAQAYSRALILSGNAAGVTVGQLKALAQAQSQVVGTQGDAAKSLAALSATGQVSALALDKTSEAVTRFARVGGDLGKTVDKFAELGKDPLGALVKFNEAENFLTESVYKQVKALTEQGRMQEAATLAQLTYADVLNERTKQIEGNLGTLQKAWKWVGDQAGKAWDSMLNIGRPDTLQDQLKAVERQLATLETRAKSIRRDDAMASAMFGVSASSRVDEFSSASRNALKEKAESLRELIRLEGAAALKQSERAASVKAAIEADKEAAKSNRAANKELEERAKLLAELAGLNGDFAADWARLSALHKAGALTLDQLTQAQARLLEKQPAVREQAQAQAAAHKQAAKALEELLKAEQKRIDAQYKIAEQVAEQVLKLQDEEVALGVAAERNISLAAAIELVRVARLEEAHARAGEAGDMAGAAALRAEIDAREKLAGLIDAKAGREAAKKTAEEAAREWQRASAEIERTITDSLMRGFESGKGLAITLRDTFVNTFKTLVLRPVIQAIVSPVTGALTAAAGSMLPGLASASSGGSALGAVAGLGSLGSLSSAFSGGWQLAGSGMGTEAFSSGWTAFTEGSGTLAGNFGQMLGAGTQMLGTAVGYISAIKALADGKYATAIGTGLGTALGGPIGAMIGSVIGSAADKLFSGGAGTPHMGADYISTGNGGYRPGANEVGIFSAGASVNQYRNQTVEDALKVLTGTGAGILNAMATTFGQQAAYKVGGYFAADGHDPSQGNTRIFSGDTVLSSTATRYASDAQEGMKAFTTELAGQVRLALGTMDIPGWAKDQLDSLATSAGFEDLANAVQSISATKTALEQLGSAMPQLGSLTDAAVTDLLKAMGGIQGLQTAASTYYDAFYSDTEKTAAATQQLGDAMAGLGLQVPTTREAFRAMVEAQDLTTVSGRATYAQLLKLSPAFAALVPASVALGDAAGDAATAVDLAAQRMADAGRKALADLADEQTSLTIELFRAQGNNAAAAELARQQALGRIVTGLSAADAAAATAAYDFNAALRLQIDTLNAATAATQAAAQAEAQRLQAVAAERDSLEVRLLQLQGDTAALRARELAALDTTNRALQERINTLLDEQALQQATAAEAGRIAAQRESLESRLLQLQGDTATLRARELAALAPANRALQELINTLTDQQAAAQAAAQAAREAAQAEAQRAAAALSQRDGIQARIDELLGNTAALRARELAGLDETNRAEQERYYALLDAKAAQDASTQAATAAAQAATQLRDAWKNIGDSLLEEAQRILGLSAANDAQSLAQVQARFGITTAQARAGDQEAAKLLPQLSRTLLELVGNTATSRADLERARAQVAASLQGTAGVLGGLFGFSTSASSPTVDVSALLAQVAAAAPITSAGAAQQQAATAAQDNLAALVQEVRALRAEVAALKADASRSAAADERMRDVLVNVTENGRAMQVENAS